MPDPREDLESTKESIRRDADLVKDLENEKTELDAEDPRVPRISEQVERLTAALHDKAAAERELSEDIQASK